jgi:hypothetical protein
VLLRRIRERDRDRHAAAVFVGVKARDERRMGSSPACAASTGAGGSDGRGWRGAPLRAHAQHRDLARPLLIDHRGARAALGAARVERVKWCRSSSDGRINAIADAHEEVREPRKKGERHAHSQRPLNSTHRSCNDDPLLVPTDATHGTRLRHLDG